MGTFLDFANMAQEKWLLWSSQVFSTSVHLHLEGSLYIYIKKGIYLLCIKSPDISSPKSICQPLSGSFGRCSWRDLNCSVLDLEEIPVLKHVLSAFIRAKWVNSKRIHPSCSHRSSQGALVRGRFTFLFAKKTVFSVSSKPVMYVV